MMFVVKFGGEVADDRKTLDRFLEGIAACRRSGIRIVIIHGGGKQATNLSRKLGLQSRIIQGRRVTDEETMEVAKMVFAGKINVDILLALRKCGIPAIGLSGVDGGLIEASRKPPQHIVSADGTEEWVDFGLAGKIECVNPQILYTLLDSGYLPVISSLGGDTLGNIYNINADTVAAHIAAAVSADKLILASDVDGIYDANRIVIPRLSHGSLKSLIANQVVTGGMIPKSEAALLAVERGVNSVLILNGTRPGSLLSPHTGTLIV